MRTRARSSAGRLRRLKGRSLRRGRAGSRDPRSPDPLTLTLRGRTHNQMTLGMHSRKEGEVMSAEVTMRQQGEVSIRHLPRSEEEAVMSPALTDDARDQQRNVAVDMVFGAIAGAAGVWVMDRVGWLMFDREDPAALAQEQRARPGGRDVAHAMVAKVGDVTGLEVPREQPNAAGLAVHYGLGMVPGALYAVARREVPAVRAGNGALYGFALFAVNDEAAAPLLGVASRPTAYPWQAHVRGAVAHAVLGVVTESVLKLFDRAR